MAQRALSHLSPDIVFMATQFFVLGDIAGAGPANDLPTWVSTRAFGVRST